MGHNYSACGRCSRARRCTARSCVLNMLHEASCEAHVRASKGKACTCDRPRLLRIKPPLPASCSAASSCIWNKDMQPPVAAGAALAAQPSPPLALQQAASSIRASRGGPSRIAHAARQQHAAMPTTHRRLPQPSRRPCRRPPASLRRNSALGFTCTWSE